MKFLQRVAALALSAALLGGSALAVTPQEAFPGKNTYLGYADVARGPGTPTPPGCAMRSA